MTKRAAETRMAEARPAVETRPHQLANPLRQAPARSTSCDTCGTVTRVSLRALDRNSEGIEVRVHFASGNDWSFLYATDPGFTSGDRVRVQGGRLMRM